MPGFCYDAAHYLQNLPRVVWLSASVTTPDIDDDDDGSQWLKRKGRR